MTQKSSCHCAHQRSTSRCTPRGRFDNFPLQFWGGHNAWMQGHCINTQTDGVSWILIVLGIGLWGNLLFESWRHMERPWLEQLFQTRCSFQSHTFITNLSDLSEVFVFCVFARNAVLEYTTRYALDMMESTGSAPRCYLRLMRIRASKVYLWSSLSLVRCLTRIQT